MVELLIVKSKVLILIEIVELEEGNMELEKDLLLNFLFVYFRDVNVSFECLKLSVWNNIFDQFIELVFFLL